MNSEVFQSVNLNSVLESVNHSLDSISDSHSLASLDSDPAELLLYEEPKPKSSVQDTKSVDDSNERSFERSFNGFNGPSNHRSRSSSFNGPSNRSRSSSFNGPSNRSRRSSSESNNFFSNPSQLEASSAEPQPFQYKSVVFHVPNTSSPIPFLNNKTETLVAELNHTLRLHQQYLNEGNPLLGHARTKIGQNLDSLSETYYALHEQYQRKSSQSKELLATFVQWDRNRNSLLARMAAEYRQSDVSDKLTALEERKEATEEEIDLLEQRLRSLRSQHRALVSEIDATRSVVESRNAKYAGAFHKLEEQGKRAIEEYLGDASSFVRRVEIEKREHKTKPVPAPKKHTVSETPKTPTVSNTSSIDNEDFHHGHGPTPFQQGYIQGTRVSEKLLERARGLVSRLAKPGTKAPPPHSNTVTSKIDLGPITELLNEQISALADHAQHTSTLATVYHQHSTLWKDMVSLLDVREKRVLDCISAGEDTGLGELLRESLQLMYRCIDEVLMHESSRERLFSGRSNPLYRALANEIAAVNGGVVLAGGEQVVGVFVEMGFDGRDVRRPE